MPFYFTKLWHDDVRPPPVPDENRQQEWYWARTNKEAIAYLLHCDKLDVDCVEASLDHDLGCENVDPNDVDALILKGNSPEGNGEDLVWCMVRLNLVPPKVTIHSWNEPGADRMAGLLTSFTRAEVIVKRYTVTPDKCPGAQYHGQYSEGQFCPLCFTP